ncbi:Alpha/Beta hydrolase protein [Phakopsora pachyrhizi]|nr:Alpha/Beta hydrolase protein [Phakopsora pachyrhizi]
MFIKVILLSLIAALGSVRWYRSEHRPPKVTLDYGSFIGKEQSEHNLERFYGIPFAEPPVGKLRFTNPIKPKRKYWNHDASKHSSACPQQSLSGNASTIPTNGWLDELNLLRYFKPLGPGKEDCLTLDVTRPKGVTKSSKLPVIWELSPKSIVKKSISLGMPIIHVTANHRLNLFGFLGGKEVSEAGVGNLGLKDQRLTLEWIKEYISEFGGDPDKVTIYGESSGAISVSHHLLAFKGQHNKLFRAAICQSGTALPVGKLDNSENQKTFDFIASKAGNCGNAKNKLECLRNAPFKELMRALKHFPSTFSYNAFPLPFAPSVDGNFVTESIQYGLQKKRFAKVPFISGDVLDEGTLLAISSYVLRTEEELRDHISKRMGRAKKNQIDDILKLWPQDPKLGSPYSSGSKYALTPVYKQYSAILGDLGFVALRRLFLRATSSLIPTWSYLDQAEQHFPVVGAYHASDIPAVFGFIRGGRKEDYQTRWISFAYKLDPNHPGLPEWKMYNQSQMNLIIEKNGSVEMQPDNFREEAIEYYLKNIDDLTFTSAM